jgi:hypothetical protein
MEEEKMKLQITKKLPIILGCVILVLFTTMILGIGAQAKEKKSSKDAEQIAVTSVVEDKSVTAGKTSTDYVDFVGTYSPTVIYENGSEKHNLYLGSSNKLYYPTRENFMVNACRAYFRLNGITAGGPSLSAGVRGIMLNFDDETTGIQEVIGVNEVGEVSDDSWYSLDGRRLSGRPTAKGLYIVNGKKMFIK